MVPENLKNQAVTPAEVSKCTGKNHYRTYIDALKSAGLDITTQTDLMNEDSDDDVFWPENRKIRREYCDICEELRLWRVEAFGFNASTGILLCLAVLKTSFFTSVRIEAGNDFPRVVITTS